MLQRIEERRTSGLQWYFSGGLSLMSQNTHHSFTLNINKKLLAMKALLKKKLDLTSSMTSSMTMTHD